MIGRDHGLKLFHLCACTTARNINCVKAPLHDTYIVTISNMLLYFSWTVLYIYISARLTPLLNWCYDLISIKIYNQRERTLFNFFVVFDKLFISTRANFFLNFQRSIILMYCLIQVLCYHHLNFIIFFCK